MSETLTLEEQLAAARGEIASLTTNVATLTQERDAATAEIADIKAQFDAATQSAQAAQAQVTELTGQLAESAKNLTETKGKLTKATENISRLEQLCGVKGIDPNAAVPPGSQQQKSALETFEALSNSNPSEATKFFNAHSDEIKRLQANRRNN